MNAKKRNGKCKFKQELISQEIAHKHFLNYENFFKAAFSPNANGSYIVLRELEIDESAMLINDDVKFQKVLIKIKAKYYENIEKFK